MTLVGHCNLPVCGKPEVRGGIAKIQLESPKEDKKRQGVTMELFKNSFFCPVTAWMKWKEISRLDNCPSLPVFRHEDSSRLTQKELNTTLKLLKLITVMAEYQATASGLASPLPWAD